MVSVSFHWLSRYKLRSRNEGDELKPPEPEAHFKIQHRVTRWAVINHLRSQVSCSCCVRTQHLVLGKQQWEFQSGIWRCTKPMRRESTTKGEDGFGWDKLLHRRSAGCSRN